MEPASGSFLLLDIADSSTLSPGEAWTGNQPVERLAWIMTLPAIGFFIFEGILPCNLKSAMIVRI
jgi:hypothetical protein